MIIQKLGLRYQPSSQDALDDHRGKMALLIEDIDGLIAPAVLERVCSAWVTTSPYMPKASDLFDAAKPAARSEQSDTGKRFELAERWNSELDQRNDPGMRWVVRGNGLMLVDPKHDQVVAQT
jgi:hypothetical protein